MAQVATKPIEIAYQYIERLQSKINIEKVILFGSAGKGKIGYDSDLDIIVISMDFHNMSFMKRLEFLSLARGRDFLSVPMDILGYTPEEFEALSKESIVLNEAKQKGKVIWP